MQQPPPSSDRSRISVAARAAPLPLPPKPASVRLREGGEELLFRARRFLVESWQDFRSSNRFFQWKAGVVAAWVAVSVVSLGVATSGDADPAENGLDAYVALNPTSMSWGLLIDNRSDEAWTDVRILLDGKWVHERSVVAPGEKLVLGPSQFRKGGEEAPADREPGAIRILADEGDATPELVR